MSNDEGTQNWMRVARPRRRAGARRRRGAPRGGCVPRRSHRARAARRPARPRPRPAERRRARRRGRRRLTPTEPDDRQTRETGACFERPSTETAQPYGARDPPRQEVLVGIRRAARSGRSRSVHRGRGRGPGGGDDRGDRRRRPRTEPKARQGDDRLQRVAGLVPARGGRRGGHLQEERARRRPEVLRRLHRVARRDGRGQARRQHPDAQRHDGGGRGRLEAGDHRGQRQLGRQRRDHLRQVDHVDRRPEGQDDRGRGRRGRPLPPAPGAGHRGADAGRHRLPRRAHGRRGGELLGGPVRLRRRVRAVHPRGAEA